MFNSIFNRETPPIQDIPPNCTSAQLKDALKYVGMHPFNYPRVGPAFIDIEAFEQEFFPGVKQAALDPKCRYEFGQRILAGSETKMLMKKKHTPTKMTPQIAKTIKKHISDLDFNYFFQEAFGGDAELDRTIDLLNELDISMYTNTEEQPSVLQRIN